MSRTPEQAAADDALTEAIERAQRADHEDDIPGVLTEYVVLARRVSWNDDGVPMENIFVSLRENSVPRTVLVGMLEYARVLYTSDIGVCNCNDEG